MGRAPSIDDAQPSPSGRTPAMSRAHSLHSSASGPNAAGPSHHEHLVLPHHFTLPGHTTTCIPSPCYVSLQQTPPPPPAPPPPLGPHLCILSVHTACTHKPNFCIAAGMRVAAAAVHAAYACLTACACLPGWQYGGVLRSWSLEQAVCKCMCSACQGC